MQVRVLPRGLRRDRWLLPFERSNSSLLPSFSRIAQLEKHIATNDVDESSTLSPTTINKEGYSSNRQINVKL